MALTGYGVPGCVKDGTWVLWENSSVVAVVAVAVVARSFLDIFREFVQNTFFHEWAPYGRLGGDRTVKIQVAAMHVFFISFYLQSTGVPAHVSFIFFRHFPKQNVIHKCPRRVWEWSGTIPDLFQPVLEQFWIILDRNRLTNNYISKSL